METFRQLVFATVPLVASAPAVAWWDSLPLWGRVSRMCKATSPSGRFPIKVWFVTFVLPVESFSGIQTRCVSVCNDGALALCSSLYLYSFPLHAHYPNITQFPGLIVIGTETLRKDGLLDEAAQPSMHLHYSQRWVSMMHVVTSSTQFWYQSQTLMPHSILLCVVLWMQQMIYQSFITFHNPLEEMDVFSRTSENVWICGYYKYEWRVRGRQRRDAS